MRNFSFLDKIFQLSCNIEGAVCLSKDGFPLQWRTANSSSIEEITSIAASLFSLGYEYMLLPENKNASLTISTTHGNMIIFELSEKILLLLLFNGTTHARVALQALDLALKEIEINDIESENCDN